MVLAVLEGRNHVVNTVVDTWPVDGESGLLLSPYYSPVLFLQALHACLAVKTLKQCSKIGHLGHR